MHVPVGLGKENPCVASDNGAAECNVVVLDSSSSIDSYDDDDVLHQTSSVCRKRKKVSIHTAGRIWYDILLTCLITI